MGFSFNTLTNVLKNPFHPPKPTDPFGSNIGVAKTYGADPNTPPQPRDLNSELSDILGQINAFAGANYNTQAKYNPQLTQLNANDYSQALLGKPTFNASAWEAANGQLGQSYAADPGYAKLYGNLDNYAYQDYLANGNNDPRYMTADPNSAISLTRTAYNQANPGLVNYTAGLQGVMDKLNASAPAGVTPTGYDAATAAPVIAGPASTARASLASGGPLLSPLTRDAMANLRTVSPIQSALNSQALNLVNSNGALTQGELQSAQDSARSAYADRGLLRSNSGIGAEILSTDQARRQRLLDNANFAMGVDAGNQSQLAANRGYALNVQGQGQNLSATNAGLLTNTSTYNTGQRNNMAQYNASLLNAGNQYNASAQNQANQFNATAANNMGQFNANLSQQQLNDAWSRAMEYGGFQLGQAQNPTALAGSLSGVTNDYTNPLLNYGSDLFNTNYNAQWSAANSAANNGAATNGALIGGGATVGAALIIAL